MKLRAAWLVFIAIYVMGCATLGPVETMPDEGGAAFRIGEEVRITMRDGSSREIVVTAASADEVCDKHDCMPTAEIAAVERREFSAGKTAALVAVIAAVVVVAAIAALSSASFAFWPAPAFPK